MTSVVSQMLGMDFNGHYHLEPLPFTLSSNATESWWHRGVRHVQQLQRLRAAIRRTTAPIVHLHTCSAFSFYRSTADMLAAQQLGCRTILHIHGAKFDAFYQGEPAWRRRLIRWSLSRADRVIALSSGWREKLRRMAPAARLVVVENAVDAPPVRPARLDDGLCRFLLLARMDRWKGIDDLLIACALLHRDRVAFRLTLAGPPGTAGDATVLDEKIRRHKLETHVRYVGSVKGERKRELLEAADAYVQPSHHEGLPISLLEALAYGLPVVATRVGAIPEVIENQRHGLLLPPRHPELLAQAMHDLALGGGRRRGMSKAVRSLAASRFSIARFRDDLAELYDSLRASHFPAGRQRFSLT
jgi:glycosyltransferase involved in cell wall biosynthesis